MAATDDRSPVAGSPTASDLSLSFRSIRLQVLTTGSIGVTIAACLGISTAVSPVLAVVVGCAFAAYALALVAYFHRRYRPELATLADHITGETDTSARAEPLPRGVWIYAGAVLTLEVAIIVSVSLGH